MPRAIVSPYEWSFAVWAGGDIEVPSFTNDPIFNVAGSYGNIFTGSWGGPVELEFELLAQAPGWDADAARGAGWDYVAEGSIETWGDELRIGGGPGGGEVLLIEVEDETVYRLRVYNSGKDQTYEYEQTHGETGHAVMERVRVEAWPEPDARPTELLLAPRTS